MFTKKQKSILILILLLLASPLFLLGCDRLPPEVAQPLRQVPVLISRTADALDDLSAMISARLDELERRWKQQESGSATPLPQDSSFAVHFIDVGQADCALVMCDGAYMLIDGGNAEDSDLVFSYLKKHGIDHLDYLVATHAHEDHIGGLSGAAYAATVGTALSPVTEGSTKVFKNLVKSLEQQNVSLTVPQPKDSFPLGSAQVRVLGPVKAYEEANDTSIVLSVTYGQTSFLFTGDMESAAEADLVESGADLSATVLKVGHHGSSSSTSYRFLREVLPDYAIISVGEGNKYGHPNEEVLSRLSDAGATVYRTDLCGTIIAKSDGSTVTFQTEKNR